MKTALVTGAAGFIGSHLCEALIERGYFVIALDNFTVGRISNLEHLLQKDLKVVQIDITDYNSTAQVFEEFNFERVFHLAALADIVPSIEKPLKYFQNNVDGTANVLELSRVNKVKKFVYAASSSCYGIPDRFPTPEDAEMRPEYPYALSKYLGEELVLHWGKVYKVPVISLRLFNVYGPRARTSGTYGAVFGVFLAQKLAGKPLTIVGDGEQTRDFTHVKDVVRAFVAAGESEIKNQFFNVGSGGHYSVNAIARLIGGERIYIPKRPGEPDCTFADISKIGELLQWKPMVKFEEGVSSLLSTISEWKDAPVWTEKLIEKETELWFKFLGNKV